MPGDKEAPIAEAQHPESGFLVWIPDQFACKPVVPSRSGG